MSGYRGKHRKHATPDELAEVSAGLAGMAGQIEIVPGRDSSKE